MQTYKTILPQHLVFEVHPTLNQNLDLKKISRQDKIWWQCPKENHEWEATVVNRLNGSGCLYCSNQKILSGYNDLEFLNPDLAAEWHPTYNNVSAKEVGVGSEIKRWWIGSECKHEWQASIASRNRMKAGCPYCSNQKILSGYNDLASQFPEVAAQWDSRKNTQSSQEVGSKSVQKYWWLCQQEGHSWEATVYRRTEEHSSCPYCSNQKILSGYNDLATTHPHLATEWDIDKNLPLRPDMVAAGTGKKIFWKCASGHSWIEQGSIRVARNTKCRVCNRAAIIEGKNDLFTLFPVLQKEWDYEKSKVDSGENALFEFIESLLEDSNSVQKNYKLSGTRKEMDIYIPSKKIAVEYNGLYWHSEKMKAQNYHKEKWLLCKQQGIQLIQIWEDDWKNNRVVVENMLRHKLGCSKETVYARKLVVNDRVDKRDAARFMVENHMQGYGVAKYFSLETLHKNPLSMMGIRYSKVNKTLEIVRFASQGSVVGGFSKLLKNALKVYPDCERVVSYSHNDHSFGEIYRNNGFAQKHDGKPGYFYISNNTRKHRSLFTKQKLAELISEKTGESILRLLSLKEKELANRHGLLRIWDSGSSLWEKTV